MNATVPSEIDLRIADILAVIPEDRKSSILDFALFIQHQIEESEGDAAWEKLITDPIPRPRLDAYVESITGKEAAPLVFPAK